MYSLISKPVYLIKHDKIIIRLFVFISPKIEKYLDTSNIVKGSKLKGASFTIFSQKGKGGVYRRKFAAVSIKNFLKFKSLRPKLVEILKSQIQFSPAFSLTLNSFEKMLNTKLSLPSPRKAIGMDLKREKKEAAKAGSTVYAELGNSGASFPERERKVYPYTSFVNNFKNNLDILSVIFSKIFKKKVEFEIIKAQLPFQDSHILAQILGYNANNYKFRGMLKILIPRAVIKNPSKELSYISSSRPHKQPAGLVDSRYALGMASKLGFKVKDLNILLSQPSSYLPPFFFTEASMNLPNLTAKDFFGKTEELSNDLNTSNATAHVETAKQGHIINDKNVFPSYLSGMNIKLAGRLMTQSIRPRFTVQSKQEGSLARVKVHLIEKSRFTGKNKRGAFSFTVTLSSVLNK
jgi:hypothetical protein